MIKYKNSIFARRQEKNSMKIQSEEQYLEAMARLKQLASSTSTTSHEVSVIQDLRVEINLYEKIKDITNSAAPIKSLLPAFHKLKIIPLLEKEGPIKIQGAERKVKNIGLIVAVGPGTKEDPMMFKVGQQVLFPIAGNLKHVESEIEYFFVNQYDIIAYSDDKVEADQ